VLFLPFHYGYWDTDDKDGRAANELTMTDWDAVSKQPLFKTSAAAISRVAGGADAAPAPTTTASAPVTSTVPPTTGGPTARVVERMGGRP
jgi:hypothetical protein